MIHIADIARKSIFTKLDFNIIQQPMTGKFCPQFINHIRVSEAQVDRDPMSVDGAWRDLRNGTLDFAPKVFENKDRAMFVAVDQVLVVLEQLGLLSIGQAVQMDFADRRVEELAARCDGVQQRLKRWLMLTPDRHPAVRAAFCCFSRVEQGGHEASIQKLVVIQQCAARG